MSKIFFIFVIAAFVYCAGAENAEAGQFAGLLSRFGIMSPMDQMRNMMNPEQWKQQAQNGQMVMMKSSAPANGKPTSEVTFLTKQNGQITENKFTNP